MTNELYKEQLIKDVKADFERRREMRRNIEAKWLLNINFLMGNQHSSIAPNGDISDYGKQYYWQERGVYNHIAPIVEARLAKFTRVNCSVNVRPASASDGDINVAKLSSKLIESAKTDNNFIGLHSHANFWAELTGTVFYKVAWNKKDKKEGDIKISVCPPYEIYPDTPGAASVEDCRSIIHARAYPAETVYDIFGVEVEGSSISVINMDAADTAAGNDSFKIYSAEKGGYVIVIERYEAPGKKYPNGRLVIVAGDELLYNGDLPYLNGADGKRTFPFVRQVALEQPVSFYGVSLIERLIPVQRAYNAVKNRKHEFLSRLSNGVMAVEEGSVDIDGLEEDGLSPGKIISYRQGSNIPHILTAGGIPAGFREEEDRLLAEFVSISGLSNYTGDGSIMNGAISGYALSLLLEQDYSRLSVTTESIRNAVREISKQILRLYRQFAKTSRIVRISGENGEPETAAFLGSELNSDDIVLEADSEMVETPAVRRSMVMELLRNGLLSDENGKLSNHAKAKILDMLGFGNWESGRNTEQAHIKKAAIENAELSEAKETGIEEVDDHEIHIEEHTRFLVSGRNGLSDKAKDIMNKHIKEHKILNRLNKEASKLL